MIFKSFPWRIECSTLSDSTSENLYNYIRTRTKDTGTWFSAKGFEIREDCFLVEMGEALRVNGNKEKETKIMNIEIDDINEALLNGEDTSTHPYWEDKS